MTPNTDNILLTNLETATEQTSRILYQIIVMVLRQ